MSLNLKHVLKKYTEHPDFVGIELLDVDQKGAVDDAPLHIAARSGKVEDVAQLIELGANVNLPGDMGNTALHYAAMKGNRNVVKLLLIHGANSKVVNEFEQSPKKVAELSGFTNII